MATPVKGFMWFICANIPYFIGYKPGDFYTSLVWIVLKSKGKGSTRLTAKSLTQTEKFIDFKGKISTQVFAYKTSKTQSHKGWVVGHKLLIPVCVGS